MAVPQNALPLRRKFRRKGSTVRIRRKNPVELRSYCGTVITVPYTIEESFNLRTDISKGQSTVCFALLFYVFGCAIDWNLL